MSPDRRRVVAVLALALAARLVATIWVGSEVDWSSGDIREYDQAARSPSWNEDVDAWKAREPGYPLFLRVAYALPGSDRITVHLLQAVAGALAAAAVLGGLRGLLPPRAALFAALWVAVAPELVWVAARPLRESIVLPLFTVHGIFFVRGLRDGARRDWIASAAAAIALVHTDARFLVTAAALPVIALAWRPRRAAVRRAAALAAVTIAATVPYSLAISRAAGHPVLVAERTLARWVPRALGQPGAAGANARTDGAGVAPGPPTTRLATDRASWRSAWESDRAPHATGVTPQDRALFEKGTRPAVTAPAVAWSRLREYWRFARPVPGYLPYPDGRYAKPWSIRHTAAAALSVLPVLLLAPFAWRGRSAPERRVLTVLVLLLSAHCLLHVASHARARYRIPAEGLWAIPAAAAASTYFARFRYSA